MNFINSLDNRITVSTGQTQGYFESVSLTSKTDTREDSLPLVPEREGRATEQPGSAPAEPPQPPGSFMCPVVFREFSGWRHGFGKC